MCCALPHAVHVKGGCCWWGTQSRDLIRDLEFSRSDGCGWIPCWVGKESGAKRTCALDDELQEGPTHTAPPPPPPPPPPPRRPPISEVYVAHVFIRPQPMGWRSSLWVPRRGRMPPHLTVSIRRHFIPTNKHYTTNKQLVATDCFYVRVQHYILPKRKNTNWDYFHVHNIINCPLSYKISTNIQKWLQIDV